MNTLIIEATNQTPYICFDIENNKFEITGKSLPEDSDEFYKPIINWLTDYQNQASEKTFFHFKFDYFNTSSSRYISAIINILNELSKTHEVKVFWYYRQIDEDMQSMGEEYYENTQVEFELVEIE